MDVVEALNVNGILLSDVVKFDQTNVRLVAIHPKTISPIGLKEVN